MTGENINHGRTKSRLIKRVLSLALVLCMGFAHGVGAEVETIISFAPEPVGSGARALGQSAFIAVADDATAASWNPAGLVNLEKREASFVGLWRTMENDPSSATPGTSLDGETWSEWEVNFMSYAQPIEVGNTDVVLSVNYHQAYDLGLRLSSTTTKSEEELELTKTNSKGAISAYSFAGALSIPSHPNVTIGASLNWYTDSLCNEYIRQVKQKRFTVYEGDTTYDWTATETLDNLSGYNFTFGLLWDTYESEENLLTLGFVCHTPFTAKVDLDGHVNYWNQPEPTPMSPSHPKLDFPLSLAMGVNYRFSDLTSIAFDAQWTEWSTLNERHTGGTSPPGDAFAFRLGGEHLFPGDLRDSVIACRGGAFYEPRPAWDDILPVYGFSLGLGWTAKERFSLDFAYQFRWGDGDFGTVDVEDFEYGIKEHWFISSIVWYF